MMSAGMKLADCICSRIFLSFFKFRNEEGACTFANGMYFWPGAILAYLRVNVRVGSPVFSERPRAFRGHEGLVPVTAIFAGQSTGEKGGDSQSTLPAGGREG